MCVIYFNSVLWRHRIPEVSIKPSFIGNSSNPKYNQWDWWLTTSGEKILVYHIGNLISLLNVHHQTWEIDFCCGTG